MAKSNLKVVSDVTNGGKSAIEQGFPYAVAVRAQGAADLLFHRWNCESVDAKLLKVKGAPAPAPVAGQPVPTPLPTKPIAPAAKTQVSQALADFRAGSN